MHTKALVGFDKWGDLVESYTGEPVVITGIAVTGVGHPQKKEAKANAALLADAINTYILTGLTPSELADFYLASKD